MKVSWSLEDHDGRAASYISHERDIRGHHIYKSIWQPIVGEQLTLEREDGNSHDRHAVSVMRETS